MLVAPGGLNGLAGRRATGAGASAHPHGVWRGEASGQGDRGGRPAWGDEVRGRRRASSQATEEAPLLDVEKGVPEERATASPADDGGVETSGCRRFFQVTNHEAPHKK